MSCADLHCSLFVLGYHNEWGVYIKRLFGDCSQSLDCELGVDVSGTQVDNASERLILRDDQRPKVAIMRQNDPAICTRLSQYDQVAVAQESFFGNRANVVPLLPQIQHDIGVDVLIRQQGEAKGVHTVISATMVLSFSRKRAAYRNASAMSSAARCG